MKYPAITTLAALLLGTAGTYAQTTAVTKPVGYVTHTLKSGQFNLIGLTMHSPITTCGTFASVSGTTLTDTDNDFTATLTAGKTYILEIIDAADTSLNGTIQEITVWGTNTITTTDDLAADGLAAGDKYQMRAAMTLSDVFGANNDRGLQGGASASVADNIYIPTAAGFEIFYYSTGGFFGVGWRRDGAAAVDFANQPIFATDGFYLRRRATTDLDFVHAGTVKLESVNIAITNEYSRVSSIYPVGSTLASSGIVDSLTGGASASVADQIWAPTATGAYEIYFYSTGGFFGIGWRKDGAGSSDQSDFELPSGLLIKRVNSTDFNLKMSVPTHYENL